MESGGWMKMNAVRRAQAKAALFRYDTQTRRHGEMLAGYPGQDVLAAMGLGNWPQRPATKRQPSPPPPVPPQLAPSQLAGLTIPAQRPEPAG